MRNVIVALSLCLASCSSYPKRRVGIVHDYIFINANKACESHEGLHYIVADSTIYKAKEEQLLDFNDYPCHDVFYFRCQDQSVIEFDDGIVSGFRRKHE